MLHGFINVNKPAGMTSHDVVAKIRRLLSTKKVGHTGTLDPQVTGVLPIAVGQATKVVEYVIEGQKTYRGSMLLGISTNTEDLTGEVKEDVKITAIPSQDGIQRAMVTLTGVIEQIPPMYSAVKINGKKLYELARKNIEIDRPARQVTIYKFQVTNVSIEELNNQLYPLISFEVACSKGTYVRTLCVQIGELLGYPACMKSLERIEAAGFHIEDSLSLEKIELFSSEKRFEKLFLPIDKPLTHMPAIHLTNEWNHKIYNGMIYYQQASATNTYGNYKIGQLFRMYDSHGVFFAIYKLNSITSDYVEWKAGKIFKEVLPIE